MKLSDVKFERIPKPSGSEIKMPDFSFGLISAKNSKFLVIFQCLMELVCYFDLGWVLEATRRILDE